MQAIKREKSKGRIKVRLTPKVGLLLFATSALLLGLWSMSRVRVLADVPFRWENRDDHVVVTELIDPSSAVAPGDVLLRLGEVPVRHSSEIEFALDGVTQSERVPAVIRRGASEMAVELTLRPRFSWRYIAINFLLGVFTMLMGAWVYFSKSREKRARLFFWLTFTLGVAILIATERLPPGPKPWIYILPGIYWFIYPFFPAVFVHFITSFPREKLAFRSARLQTRLIYAPAFFFAVVMQASHLVTLFSRDVEHFRDYFRLYDWHRLYLVVFFFLALATLLHSFITAKTSSDKDKVRWVLWGLAAGCSPFIVLWSIPLILGAAPLVHEDFTYLALLLTPLSIAFAIVKHRFLDIDVVINRSLVYGVLTVMIAGAYLLISALAGQVLLAMSPEASRNVTIFCTLIAALLFNPAKQKVQNFIDRTFYRVKYNYRLVTKEFAQRMVKTRTQAEVLEELTAQLRAAVPFEQMAILSYAYDRFAIIVGFGIGEEARRRLVAAESTARLKSALQSALLAAGDSQSVAGAVLEPPLAETHFEMLLPVPMSAGESGILLLGPKLSGEKYSEEDLELFAALATEAFNAMARIRFQETAMQERAEREKLEALNRLKDEKNRELELKNQEIIRAQEKLVTQEKLASLGALTAGIAHEIKNPLNFVNNFASLSVELAKELEETLQPEKDKISPEKLATLEDILHHLKNNAEKINHHGKRADGIVRSMMMHSRGRTGQREMTDVNYLLDEAVNLTYHGLRAQDISFNVAIEKQYDETIGKIEVVPQDLQRVFLNIINNACYAAHEKKIKLGDNFSPKLSVFSRNLQNKIEIRIRDNGNGIPAEVREKIFNPFFTTKPTGQGTGLGLSISYEIIVQQYRGEINVETEEGKFTEFVVRLPRQG
jgi:signal transduction histidine kinase